MGNGLALPLSAGVGWLAFYAVSVETFTFLFTDIEGSTALRPGPGAAAHTGRRQGGGRSRAADGARFIAYATPAVVNGGPDCCSAPGTSRSRSWASPCPRPDR